ncbi:MAG: hypothetical protein M1831_000049 [Alyxoria varia]|nr:MAG: hypothetical protein M1831_000049 [Alyxoria varia]
MARKAAKQTARRNTEILNRTHVVAFVVNVFYLLLRALIFRDSFTRKSLLLYVCFTAPALAIEAVFERNGRPKYNGNDLGRSGDDLEASGITEWLWDVLYWTWGCIIVTGVVGDWAWWLYAVVPLYSLWLAYTTFSNVRSGFGAGPPSADGDSNSQATGSKRQQKIEKRGGQSTRTR